MNFEKKSDDMWEIYQENCLLGYIVKEDNEMFFDMKSGINPSFEFKELQEIVKFMENLQKTEEPKLS